MYNYVYNLVTQNLKNVSQVNVLMNLKSIYSLSFRFSSNCVQIDNDKEFGIAPGCLKNR